MTTYVCMCVITTCSNLFSFSHTHERTAFILMDEIFNNNDFGSTVSSSAVGIIGYSNRFKLVHHGMSFPFQFCGTLRLVLLRTLAVFSKRIIQRVLRWVLNNYPIFHTCLVPYNMYACPTLDSLLLAHSPVRNVSLCVQYFVTSLSLRAHFSVFGNKFNTSVSGFSCKYSIIYFSTFKHFFTNLSKENLSSTIIVDSNKSIGPIHNLMFKYL